MKTAPDNTPLIVAFVGDLFFIPQIENVARQLHFRLQLVAEAGVFGPAEAAAPENQAAEPVYGRDAQLMEQLTTWQPALLIFDLGNEAIPWAQWLAAIKSSPATRRLPVLCFGAHVAVEQINRAKELGADAVVARSRFVSALPQLIEKYARRADRAAPEAACGEPLSELARRGLNYFNAGDFYEAHELLEDAWNEDPGAGRELYRAILQVAVAYLQIERGNYAGAVKMFLRSRQWFQPYPDVCRGIDVAQLRADAQAVHEALLALGPERIGDFDRQLFRPARFVAPASAPDSV
jgi:CheY-like chemotaxis protein